MSLADLSRDDSFEELNFETAAKAAEPKQKLRSPAILNETMTNGGQKVPSVTSSPIRH